MSDETTLPRAYMAGWPVEKLLENLPMLSGVVRGGERMKGASDPELLAWAHGIEQTAENVRQIIDQWRNANADA